jgi:hypothetical protein
MFGRNNYLKEKNMSDDILNLACNFDWITPSWMILQDFLKGPVSRFGIQANVGFDRGDIKRLLSKFGVDSWGYVYNVAGDMIMISVPQKQARRAYYFLRRGRVPILYAPDEVINSFKEPGTMDWLEATLNSLERRLEQFFD